MITPAVVFSLVDIADVDQTRLPLFVGLQSFFWSKVLCSISEKVTHKRKCMNHLKLRFRKLLEVYLLQNNHNLFLLQTAYNFEHHAM